MTTTTQVIYFKVVKYTQDQVSTNKSVKSYGTAITKQISTPLGVRSIFETVPAFVPALRVKGLVRFADLEDRGNFSMYFMEYFCKRQTQQNQAP